MAQVAQEQEGRLTGDQDRVGRIAPGWQARAPAVWSWLNVSLGRGVPAPWGTQSLPDKDAWLQVRIVHATAGHGPPCNIHGCPRCTR